MKEFFRVRVAFATLVVALGAPHRLARADAAQPAQPDDRPASEDGAHGAPPEPLRLGAIAGVGFPRPLAVEGMAVFEQTAALGVEYGVLPSTSVNGVQASLWSVAGDVRLFPLRGAFFVGLRAGLQHLEGSTQVTVSSIAAPETLTLDTWFVNPRLGGLWTFEGGLTLGVEAGLQIPVGNTMVSTLPLAMAPSAQQTANTLASSVIPTVDLLRIGLLL